MQALHLLDSPDWDSLVAATAPLRRQARESEPDIARRPLPRLRPEVRRLVRGEPADGLLNTCLVLAPPPYSRQWTFDARHVPHRVDETLWQRHFAPFADLQPDSRHGSEFRVRRCAAVALVQMAHRCSQQQALALLGVPAQSGYSKNLAALDDALARTGRTAEFRDALHGAATDIENDPARIDHAALRAALADWTVPPDDWQRLVALLRPLQYQGRGADWGEQRRLCTTAVVWEHIVGGDILYAPVLSRVAADDRRRFGGYLSNYRTRLHAGKIAGWDAVVVPYADRLAHDIQRRPPTGLTGSWNLSGVLDRWWFTRPGGLRCAT